MKLTDEERAALFKEARALSPTLGALFQNPMDITPEDLQREIDEVYRAQAEAVKRYQAYCWKLGEKLCFPNGTN